ncbi:transposase [Streptomyces capoamus]|uniref:transposase n=1 Tax=Streptomyces capoamus TaxID=68183 RepID=UPI003EB97BCD
MSSLLTAGTTTTSTAPWSGGGVKPLVGRRGAEHGSGLGTQHSVVERVFAHLHRFHRLRIRWEIRDDIQQAFLTLACAVICWRRLVAVQGRHS